MSKELEKEQKKVFRKKHSAGDYFILGIAIVGLLVFLAAVFLTNNAN